MPRPEFKSFPGVLNQTIQSTAATPYFSIVLTDGMKQGTAVNERIGREVYVHGFNLCYDLRMTHGNQNHTAFVRVLGIRCKVEDAANLTLSDVLTHVCDPLVAPYELHNQLNHNVFYDKVCSFAGVVGDDDSWHGNYSNGEHFVNTYLKYDKKVQYDSNNKATYNGIKFFFVPSKLLWPNETGDPQFQLHFFARLRYTDC